MSISPTVFLSATLLAGTLCGAANAGVSTCSPVTANWGAAYGSAKKAQIANPEAGASTRPVEGLDGIAAELAMAGYRAGFGKAQAPTNYNINLGEISGVGQK